MTVRASRRIWFLAIFLLAPAPLLVLTRGWMPPATYVLLTMVSGAVVVFEGAAGPVPMIVSMFALHAVLYTLASWLAAWAIARLLSGCAPRTRRLVTLGVVATGLVVALGCDVYRTPFGRRPVGNAIEALS